MASGESKLEVPLPVGVKRRVGLIIRKFSAEHKGVVINLDVINQIGLAFIESFLDYKADENPFGITTKDGFVAIDLGDLIERARWGRKITGAKLVSSVSPGERVKIAQLAWRVQEELMSPPDDLTMMFIAAYTLLEFYLEQKSLGNPICSMVNDTPVAVTLVFSS